MAEQFGAEVGAAAEHAADNGNNVREAAGRKARAAADAGRRRRGAAAAEGRRRIESVSGAIRDRPLPSVGVAFLASCLVSRLLRGR